MAVPDFQSFLLPLLKLAADGKEHSIAEAREALVRYFKLSDEDLSQMLPSGKQATFNNRVQWAKVYLSKALLLDNPKRGTFALTERGRALLDENHAELKKKDLFRYPEFVAFDKGTGGDSGGDTGSGGVTPATPEEVLENAFQEIRNSLADEIITQVQNNTPQFFERLVVKLLVKMGYGGSIKDAGQAMGRSGDEGIDGIIKEDKLGLDVIYIQAKRWQGSVGRPEIQKFVGALHGQRAKKGVFITTGTFTKDAAQYVSTIDPKVVLIDGKGLVDLMIDYNMGVSTVDSYEIKKIDSDFFLED
jgi:restriction system protein